MADVEVTADDQRAAGVPKVKREDAKESVAADAAKRIDQPAPRGAEAKAEELAELRAEQEDGDPVVEVKLAKDFQVPEGTEEVVINHARGSFKISPDGTAEIKASDLDAIGDNGVVEVSS